MRFMALAVLVLGACTSEPEELRTGVGFGDLDEYRAQRQAELQGARQSAIPDPLAVGTETVGAVAVPSSGAPLSAIPNDAAAIRQAPGTPAPVAPVTATALPTRPGGTEPNIVAYALATSNPVGTSIYPRNPTSEAQHARACARFAGPDQAQIAFLKAGGPERDRDGLDPDGDGYACWWDPEAFRNPGEG